MVYPENFEVRIGFDVIREQCCALCTMHGSEALLRAEKFSTSAREVMHRQSLVDEMRVLLMSEASVLKEEFFDIDDLVDKLRIEGTFLDVEEVVRLGITLEAADAVVGQIAKSAEWEFSHLRRISSDITPLTHILTEIARIVDNHGAVRDSASERLAEVRREIRQSEGLVSKRLQSVLSSAKNQGIVDADAAISIREGRAVIPVAAHNKRKLQGFIHDESATGKTFYIEPVEVVELNNRLKELEYEERREIVRILTEFTSLVRVDVEMVALTGEYVAQIDMIRAKARWGAANDAVSPILAVNSQGLEIWLRDARHPLLAQSLQRTSREVVPLDVRLDTNSRILIISGPNAGGKSVCLKTIGLLQYMFQCGFPITASASSELPIFKKIYIDIGDQQSIENDLSTYSSHLLNMKAMLSGVDESTLILIDEFGSGTEPNIGAAIAESILERFVESRCFGVITTHYTNIKYYASSHEGIINGAMMFDVQNIRPLFKLEIGKPGSSFAIEIARKIGLPESIILSAKEKVGNEQIDLERQLREIARDKRYWEQKRERIRHADRKVEALEQDYQQQLSEIREQRRAILHEAKEQARELIASANRKIETTIKEIRETQAAKEQTRMLRRDLDSFREQVEQNNSTEDNERLEREMARIERRKQRRQERKNSADTQQSTVQTPVAKPLPMEVGAKVRLRGHEGVGTVEQIRSKRAQVSFGQILTTVEISRLEVISAAEFRRATRPEKPTTTYSSDISQRRLNFTSSVDIRGMRVAEAMERVQSLVDDALMLGVGSVSILHGKGTGALKEEVRRYLLALPEVARVQDDHPDRGGAGITLVTFGI